MTSICFASLNMFFISNNSNSQTLNGLFTTESACAESDFDIYRSDMPICDEYDSNGVTYYCYEQNCWSGGDEDCEENDCEPKID